MKKRVKNKIFKKKLQFGGVSESVILNGENNFITFYRVKNMDAELIEFLSFLSDGNLIYFVNEIGKNKYDLVLSGEDSCYSNMIKHSSNMSNSILLSVIDLIYMNRSINSYNDLIRDHILEVRLFKSTYTYNKTIPLLAKDMSRSDYSCDDIDIIINKLPKSFDKSRLPELIKVHSSHSNYLKELITMYDNFKCIRDILETNKNILFDKYLINFEIDDIKLFNNPLYKMDIARFIEEDEDIENNNDINELFEVDDRFLGVMEEDVEYYDIDEVVTDEMVD